MRCACMAQDGETPAVERKVEALGGALDSVREDVSAMKTMLGALLAR